MKTFAQIVSNIFSPITTIPALVFFFLFSSHVSFAEFWSSILLFVLAGIIPVTCTLIYLKKTKRISDWEVQKRQERYLLNALILLFGAILLVLLFIMRLNAFLTLASILWIWFFIFSAITYFWKISGHTASYALLYLFVFHFGLVVQITGFLLLVLLCWSRIVLKHHTPLQTVGGVLLSAGIFILHLI